MRTEPEHLVRLLCFASPAFPTGGFAYSHGIEAAIEAGDIADGQGLRAWLADLLRFGSGRSDAILLRHAHRAQGDADSLAYLAEFAAASCIGRERQAETVALGAAFAASATAWQTLEPAPYPVAFGVMAARRGIDECAACLGFLTGWASNLISAAVRLGALGQTAGLRVLLSLERTIIDVADETRTATIDDIGGACFLADIASMRHETQYSRLFRS